MWKWSSRFRMRTFKHLSGQFNVKCVKCVCSRCGSCSRASPLTLRRCKETRASTCICARRCTFTCTSGCFIPAVLGLCRQVWGAMAVWTDVVARLLRSTTDGVGGVGGGACCRGTWGGCGFWEAWSLCAVLEGMPFSNRNSSRSMYSSWKPSPS